jgi:hypothetical protein
MCFVGRAAELQQLEELLVKESALGLHAAIEGLAGIGKTELALQLAYRCARDGRFPGGIFWLDASARDLRPAWGTTLADECGLPEGALERRASQLLRQIQALRQPVLVVLDDVLSWGSEERPAPLPSGPHVHTLATTRVRNLGGSQFKHVELGVLDPPHDEQLVVALAGRQPDPGLPELLAELRGHALALELAGAFLGTYRAETARSYLAALRASDDVEVEVSGRVRYEQTATQAFRTLADRLAEPVRHAWRVASQFAPEPATRELAAAAGLHAPALRSLEEMHLVQATADGRWTMHRLTHAFGRRDGAPHERAAARQSFLRGCIARALLINRGAGFAVYLADRAHFDAALAAAREAGDPELELQLLVTAGPARMAYEGYGPEPVQDLFARALESAERLDRKEPLVLALSGLWTSSFMQGDWQRAAPLLARMQELAHRDPSDLNRLQFYLASGVHGFYTGADFDAAREWFERGLPLARSSPPVPRSMALDPSVALLAYGGLALCACGALEQGIDWSREAVERAADRDDRLTLIVALVLRAGVHELLRQTDQVERDAARALTLCTAQELAPHRDFASSLLSWARIGRDPAHGEAALAAMEAALQGVAQVSSGMARSHLLGLAAEACARLGRREHGRALIEQALLLAEETGERFAESELWRVRAALCDSRAEAARQLAHAVELAARKHARLWELRALTDWLQAADTPAARRAASARLQELLCALPAGSQWIDLQRARAALGKLAG